MRSSIYKEQSAQKRRLVLLGVILVIFALVIGGKLFYLQVFRHGYYIAFAENQHYIKRDIPAERGKIYVRDSESGKLYPLATNISLDMVYAIPYQVQDPILAAQKLAPILKMKEVEILKMFERSKYYVPLKHKLTEKQSQQIKALKLNGIMVTSESWRYYPEKRLASHILGYVDWDQRGHYGLEGYFNESLRGKTGFMTGEKDQAGRLISIGNLDLEPPRNGDDLILTVDRTIQYEVEKVLAEGVKKHGAQSGSIIVMDPKTGGILAMANYPDFNPNRYYKFKNYDIFNNSSINSVYEPGSIFKPIVMAAALNEGKVKPDDTHQCTGYVRIGNDIVRTSTREAHGKETMTQVIINSCNVGMAKLTTEKMGKELIYDYLIKFGFSSNTGIMMDTENKGNIRQPKDWAEIDVATSGFGQGLGVTSLQMVTAFSALANEGNLVQPRIIDEVIHSDGSKEKKSPKLVRQVISKDTAKTITAMLIAAVEEGYVQNVKIPGYYVAGKTGTAEVARADGQGYDPTRRITTFIGYLPANNARFIILVKLDLPNSGPGIWGITTSAPMFKEVAQYLIQYYRIPPER